jgi:hypothetical protein
MGRSVHSDYSRENCHFRFAAEGGLWLRREQEGRSAGFSMSREDESGLGNKCPKGLIRDRTFFES